MELMTEAEMEKTFEQIAADLQALAGIVAQLEICEFECVAGPLANSLAFRQLKEIAERYPASPREYAGGGEERHTHKWMVVDAVMETGCLRLRCECGTRGVVRDTTAQEWDEAFLAHLKPYEWQGGNSRVVLTFIPKGKA